MHAIVFSLVVSMLLLLPLPVDAGQGQQGSGMGRGGHENGMRGPGGMQGRGLEDLSPERQQVFWEDHAERMYRLNTRMHLDFAELEEELAREEPNQTRIQQLQEEISRLHSQMLHERISLHNQLRQEGLPIHGRMQDYVRGMGSLSPEQREAFLEIWGEHDREMARVDSEMRSTFRRLQEELAQEEPDQERIRELQREMNRLHDDSLELQTEMHLQMREAGIPLHPRMRPAPPYGRMPFLE